MPPQPCRSKSISPSRPTGPSRPPTALPSSSSGPGPGARCGRPSRSVSAGRPSARAPGAPAQGLGMPSAPSGSPPSARSSSSWRASAVIARAPDGAAGLRPRRQRAQGDRDQPVILQRSGLAPGTGGREAARAMGDSDRETRPTGRSSSTVTRPCRHRGHRRMTSRLPEAAKARVRELTDAAMAGERPGASLRRAPGRHPPVADLAEIASATSPRRSPALARPSPCHPRQGGAHRVRRAPAAILPLADVLGIAAERVHAVGVQLDGEGNYVDFERDSPSPGRRQAWVVRAMASNGRAALVGDGATDLEARSALARFVCFAGAGRPAVVAAADAVVRELDLTRTSSTPHGGRADRARERPPRGRWCDERAARALDPRADRGPGGDPRGTRAPDDRPPHRGDGGDHRLAGRGAPRASAPRSNTRWPSTPSRPPA